MCTMQQGLGEATACHTSNRSCLRGTVVHIYILECMMSLLCAASTAGA